jgi:hypothetical protein
MGTLWEDIKIQYAASPQVTKRATVTYLDALKLVKGSVI